MGMEDGEKKVDEERGKEVGRIEEMEGRRDTADKKKLLFWAILIIALLAISRGYGIQLKYSILNDQRQHFYPPFLLMWFNTSCLLICFPLYLLYAKLRAPKIPAREVIQQSTLIFSKSKFKIGTFLWMELIFLLLFNVNNYTNSLSLGRISTSAALSIHSLEVSIVYLLGRLFLHEQFYIVKTLGVFMAMAGVLLIAMDEEFAADLLGVLLKLAGCMASSIHKVAFKRAVGNAVPGQSMFFLSGMGLANLVVNFPPALLLLHFGIEQFHFDYIPWLHLLGFVFLTFVFNFCSIFGVALLSPVIISIGLLSGVPISIGVDIIQRDHVATWKFIAGTIFLTISVILATFHEQIRKKVRRQRKNDKMEREEMMELGVQN